MANPFKDKLRRGEPAVMVNPNVPAAGLAEHLGRIGADAIFIDCEHGPASFEDIDNLVRAAHLVGISTVLRPDCCESWRLTRFLDRGIDGLMVPHVESAEAARKIVEIVRYTLPEEHAEKLVMIMVESVSTVPVLGDILAVDGVDGVFCGSGDMGKSMGYTDKRHPAVQKQVQEIMTAVAKAGKIPGRFVTFGDVQACIQGGARLLYIHNNHFMDYAAKAFVGLVRGAL